MKILTIPLVLRILLSATVLGGNVPIAKAGPIAPAKAGPMATWLTPWDLSYQNNAFSSVAERFDMGYSFGVGAPHNSANPGLTVPGPLGNLGAAGEALPGTPGHFEEDVATSVSFAFPTIASEQVVFARPFGLADSPTGWWTVGLSGNYTAYGLVANARFNPVVHLSFRASVYQLGIATINDILRVGSALNGNKIPILGYAITPDLRTNTRDPNVLGPLTAAFTPASGQLSDGTYWVVGTEFVSSSIDGSFVPLSRGSADGLIDATINLNATPGAVPPPPPPPEIIAPEPSSLVLFGTGILGLGLGRKLKRRR